ncbi:MAG: chorismate mutase [Gaiellales bacterium]
MTSEPAVDPVVRELRALISRADREILEAANRRLELVLRLHRHKATQGYPMVDPAREEALLAALVEQNAGPLSDDGVRELFRKLVEISKREAAAAVSAAPPSA